jgi:hypothetical protein
LGQAGSALTSFEKIFYFFGVAFGAAAFAFVAAVFTFAVEAAELEAVFAAWFVNCSVAGVWISAPFALSPVFEAPPTSVFVFVAGASAGVAGAELSTDVPPLKDGREINSAEIMNMTAAAIVIFDKTVAVPRGPNALLLTLLVKSAPASVLPGCSKTAPTRTMHDAKNNVYKAYNKITFRF